MLSWMLYAIVIGVLTIVAASALDPVASGRKWPTRFLWLGAVASALVWPVASAGRALFPASAPNMLPFTYTLPALRVGSEASATSFGVTFGEALALAWGVISMLLLARLVADVVILRQLRHRWPVRDIDGRLVRLTGDIGPAVVGLRRLELVLPEWILSLDEPLRALVLRHEEEHRDARDPYFLIAARIATVSMPWNPAIWYAARRLRFAVELDCDARVLRALPSPRRYGMLLLTMAQRGATMPTALAPSLSASTTQLERRILAMRTAHPRLSRRTALAAACVAAGAIVLACSVQSDTSPKASTPLSASKSSNAAAPSRAPTSSYLEFQVEKQATIAPGGAAPRYPVSLRLRKIEGQVLVQFVIDTMGRADMRSFKVVKSSNPLFTQEVKQSLVTMKFYPAEVGGRKVKQLLQMPFVFSLYPNRRQDQKLPNGASGVPPTVGPTYTKHVSDAPNP